MSSATVAHREPLGSKRCRTHRRWCERRPRRRTAPWARFRQTSPRRRSRGLPGPIRRCSRRRRTASRTTSRKGRSQPIRSSMGCTLLSPQAYVCSAPGGRTTSTAMGTRSVGSDVGAVGGRDRRGSRHTPLWHRRSSGATGGPLEAASLARRMPRRQRRGTGSGRDGFAAAASLSGTGLLVDGAELRGFAGRGSVGRDEISSIRLCRVRTFKKR